MKGKFLNTKNVVIGLVSLVLIAASVTGVTVFLKNRGQAEAAGEQVQNLPATGRKEQDNNQVQNPGTTENPDNQNGGTEIPGTPVEPTTPGTTPSAEPNQTTTGNSTTGNTERPNRENTNIQETEIERTNTTISEASTLGWTTIALSSITTDNMGLFKPELSISKTATEVIKNSDSEVAIQSENVLPSVKAGDEIIYTIRVENNGNYVAKDIIIKDMLPVVLGTRVSQDSDEVTFENQPVIPANTEIAKLDLEAKKAAILKVKYTVTQEDIDNLENTSIANIATVTLPGEDPIEDGDTSIEKEQEEDYEIYKISTLNKKDGNKDEKAEVGDTITYTITVENTGTVTLEDLNVIDEMIELNEKITLKPGDKKVFEEDYEITASDIAKALDNDSKIKNTAVVKYKDNEDKPGKNEEDVKTSYNLTINYVYENGETASETYTDTLNYLSNYNVTSPEITGYKTETTVVKGEMPAHDVTVTVVYVKDETQTKKVNYKVEYYKDGVKVDADSYTTEKDVWVNAPDTVVVDPVDTANNKYVGYKFENTDPSTIPAEVATGSVIKVYYVKDETQTKKVNYKVEYYKDGVKVDVDSYTTEKDVWVNAPDTVVVDPVDTRVDKYVGYKLANTDPSTIPAEVTTGSVIKVYYVKDSFSYRVEYYYDGVIDNNKTVPNTAEYDSIITTYEDKVITGYVLEKVTPVDNNNNVSLRITENADNNVIRVYYVKDNFDYTVEYYKDTISEANKLGETGKISKPYGTVLTEKIIIQDLNDTNWINAEKPTGYKDGEVQEYITIDTANNVIRVLYEKRTDLHYTVKYYYNNEYKSEYTKTATYNSTINVNNVEDRSIDGNNVQWHLLELKPSEITIGLDESENVIEVYYVLPNITVTKSIWQNGKDVTDKTIEAGSTVTYKLTASNTGYENGSVTITDEQIPEGTIKTEDVETVNKLKANGIVLEVPANSSETIEFTLTLTGKIGTAISNTAEFDGTPTNTVNNEVEKTVQLKANSETVQITNSNVIVIIDTSGSMSSKPVVLDGVCEKLICFKNHVYRNGKNYHYHYKDEPTKINNAKQVTKDFIDMIELPAQEDKSSSAIEVIQFNSDASIVGTATKASDVADLKSSIDKISLKGQTNVTNALTLASTEIDKLKQERPDNQNIVIFVSDGYPEGDTMTNIKNAAAKLHGKATVYAIGLDMDIDVLKTVVASDPSKYKTTLQASSLKDIFQDIKTDIVGKYKPTQSVAGKIELTDIDMTKSIIIKVNGKEIPATDIDSKLIKDETNKKYYVDLNQFSLSDEVTVEYTKTK